MPKKLQRHRSLVQSLLTAIIAHRKAVQRARAKLTVGPADIKFEWIMDKEPDSSLPLITYWRRIEAVRKTKEEALAKSDAAHLSVHPSHQELNRLQQKAEEEKMKYKVVESDEESEPVESESEDEAVLLRELEKEEAEDKGDDDFEAENGAGSEDEYQVDMDDIPSDLEGSVGSDSEDDDDAEVSGVSDVEMGSSEDEESE